MAHFDPNLLPYFNPLTDRRVCLITGGNSGIGYYTVLHLYLHGYTVYLAGRSKNRVLTAIESIKREAQARRSNYTPTQLSKRFVGSLHHLQIDLLSLDSVEEAGKVFQSLEKSLHLLILNAGIMAVPYSKTNDDIEIQLQTNYISHFLLTDRLIDLMTSTQSDEEAKTLVKGSGVVVNKFGAKINDPRIIFLSSIGHWFTPFHFSLDSQFNYHPDIFFTLLRYGMAKCAGIQFAKSLARRHPSVLSVAVHPGIVLNTNLFNHLTNLPLIGTIYWILFQIFDWIIGVSNEEGSYATLKCALSDDLYTCRDNGKYFMTYGVESTPSWIANNEKYGDESWAWTIELLRKKGHDIKSL